MSDAHHISTLDLRAQLGELLDRVRLRFDSFVVERKGKEIAALVPVERMRRLEEFARKRSKELSSLQAARVKGGGDAAEAKLLASLARVRAKRRGSKK